MLAIPERLRDVSCIGAIQIDINFTFTQLLTNISLCERVVASSLLALNHYMVVQCTALHYTVWVSFCVHSSMLGPLVHQSNTIGKNVMHSVALMSWFS